MKVSVLLLVLWLHLFMADSNGPASVVKGCLNMWLEFTCKCTRCGSQGVKVKMPNSKVLTLTRSNEWKDHNERLSLYYNMTSGTVRLFIKKLKVEDLGEYTCFPTNGESSEENSGDKNVNVQPEIIACYLAAGFAQTAYCGVGTTIMCNYQGNSLTNNVYLCKQDLNNNKCEESIPRSSQRLIQAGLSVALTQVSLADNGVYWCAFRKDNYQGAYQKIVLSVKDFFTHSATVTAGETFVYSSNYSSFNVSSGRSGVQRKKFLCKGGNPTTCTQSWNREPVVSDNQQLCSITVTLQEVTLAHTGTYWCGARSYGRSSHLIFYRLQLQVVSPANPLPTVTTPAASCFYPSASEFWLVTAVAVACAALLLLVLTHIFVYIFCQRRQRRVEAVLQQRLHCQEETTYTEVEMQHSHHQAVLGIASKATYSTASAANLHEEENGDTYSSVMDTKQAPTYSTVGHPTEPGVEDPSADSTPLYHTVVQH